MRRKIPDLFFDLCCHGLVYVTDELPGVSRHRSGIGFSYRTPDGKLLRGAEQIDRIRRLAIPPA